MHSRPSSIAQRNDGLSVLIAAGGTGGHVYPAIAIADALKKIKPGIEILFVGTKTHLENEAVPKAGYTIENIWISGFHRRFTLKNLLFPLKLIVSLLQSWRILSSFGPDAVLSCGGYVAGPVGWMAQRRNTPLFIQEQNSYPGVTNRMLARKAAAIFTAFNEADRYFPLGKTQLLGNPTRHTLTEANRADALQHFGFNDDKKTILILGGSGGARAINEAVKANLQTLHNELNLQIIWQCGERYFLNLTSEINQETYPRLHLTDFLHHMPQAYAAADLVISRAGALSCSELALTGNACILVPSPNVAGDHQAKNATAMVQAGAAQLAKDESLKENLAQMVRAIIEDQQKLQSMRAAAKKMSTPTAAHDIAQQIIEHITQQPEAA